MCKIANDQICPVCGEHVQLIEIESVPDYGPRIGCYSWQVICDECGAQGPYKIGFGSAEQKKQYAIDGWNKLIGVTK